MNANANASVPAHNVSRDRSVQTKKSYWRSNQRDESNEILSMANVQTDIMEMWLHCEAERMHATNDIIDAL